MLAFDEIRSVLESVVPDLQLRPWYLLAATDSGGSQTRAYALQRCQPEMRASLVGAGHWKGPGPVVVMNYPLPDDHDEMLGLLVHEVSHILPMKPQAEDKEPTADEFEFAAGMQSLWSKLECEPTEQATPWLGHDAAWIRRVLHIHYRLMWEGVAIPLALLGAAGPRYGLSHISRYIEAIGSEPFKLNRYSFAEIETIPMPAEFSELFARDCAAWNSRKEIACQKQQPSTSSTT